MCYDGSINRWDTETFWNQTMNPPYWFNITIFWLNFPGTIVIYLICTLLFRGVCIRVCVWLRGKWYNIANVEIIQTFSFEIREHSPEHWINKWNDKRMNKTRLQKPSQTDSSRGNVYIVMCSWLAFLPRFFSNSGTEAPELLENIEEMFPLYYMQSDILLTMLKSHIS